jgi:hypothetical protein
MLADSEECNVERLHDDKNDVEGFTLEKKGDVTERSERKMDMRVIGF